MNTSAMVALGRHRRLFAALAVTALGIAIGAPPAHAAPYARCTLSLADQDPPGGTPAYNLAVEHRNSRCATAKQVMVAFHRCRTAAGHRCTKKVLAAWRCSGRTDKGTPTFHGSFTCTAGRRAVRSSYHQDTPSCLGAAARDPKLPCVNTARSISRPDDTGYACVEDAAAGACTFGYRGTGAAGSFAVVGDSHAFHWRSPLNVVAQIERWRGYSHSVASCFFSEAVGRWLAGCEDWYRTTLAWFGAHPEVSTVFVTQNADTPVAVEPGETELAVKVDGFQRAWQALPPTVTHIIVLRDTTISTTETLECVKRLSAAATTRLATACPLPRSIALRTDTAEIAARRLGQTRYQVIDLSSFFCAPSVCYPVVGGMGVNGDIYGHIDTAFTRTLGPYLLRAVRALMASW